MAKYWDDYSSYTVDTQPSGYTKRGSTANTTDLVKTGTGYGLKQLECVHSVSAAYRLFSKDSVDSDADRDDVEILIKCQASANSTSHPYVYAMVRASGTNLTAYMAGLPSGKLVIYEMTAGSRATLAEYSFSWSANTWYFIRFRVNGTSLKAKVWASTSAEPSSWHIETTDSTITAAGWVGTGGFVDSTIKIDALSIATNGDTALMPPTVTTDSATNVSVYSATLNGTLDASGGDTCTIAFEYGLTTSYGSTVSAGTGTSGDFSANIEGLEKNTTYHYRISGVNSTGTISYSADATFTTLNKKTATNLDPSANETINPTITNIFSWDKDATGTQTNYEIEYRIIEAGAWSTTGDISSAVEEHEFASEFFDYEQSYEWRVYSYNSAAESDYYVSKSALFNTINPPSLSAISLTDLQEVELGVVYVSAVITSVYDVQCKLIISVADNALFTGATDYEGIFVDSGETSTVEILLNTAGVFYIRIKAVDANTAEYYEDISVTVIRTFNFIDQPDVKLQGPQATHVTVRIKDSDPLVEYTAHTTPEAGANDMIERLVIIDSGTVTTCQNVAEQLIERWGREQVSVSGNINLCVTLNFLEKIHIIDNQSGIDGEYILQYKEHNVNEMLTSIVVGDIILDDTEILARIFDELSK